MDAWQLTSEMVVHLEDQGLRPHLAIQTRCVGSCGFPDSIVKDCGHVILNVSKQATNGSLRIGMYQCVVYVMIRGQHYELAWHPDAITAVYSPDGGAKLIFPEPDPEKVPADRRKPKPALKLVS